MGQKTTLNHTRGTGGAGRERFTRYFPRLFAYLQAMTGNEIAAREAATAAFEATLRDQPSSENDFTLSLFSAARELCRPGNTAPDGLTEMEREALSLTFDAQLSRGQVAALLGIAEDTLVMALLGGLRRLRDTAGTGGVPRRAVHGGLPA